MVDFWIMVGLVAIGALGIAGIVLLRARGRRDHWSLFDVALAFAALLWVSGGVGALAVRAISGGWNAGALIPLVPTISISALGSFAAVAVSLALGRPWRELGFRPTTHSSLVLALGRGRLPGHLDALGERPQLPASRSGSSRSSRCCATSGGPPAWCWRSSTASGSPRCSRRSCSAATLPPLVRALGPAPAIAPDALASVLHLDDPVAPPLALLGATLAWLLWRTGSLWPSFVPTSRTTGRVPHPPSCHDRSLLALGVLGVGPFTSAGRAASLASRGGRAGYRPGSREPPGQRIVGANHQRRAARRLASQSALRSRTRRARLPLRDDGARRVPADGANTT
jgi:hypothetical protein